MPWGNLNKRQQTYLRFVFEVDQAQEASVKRMAARGDWVSSPAALWRWMPYNAAGATLLGKIQAAGYRDEGTGSTFAALERRGLVLCRYEPGSLGGPILFVQITRSGRKMVREALGLKAPKALPVGSLREWHWKALVHAYQAGDTGISEWPRGVGRNTVLRLEDYRVKGEARPLIAWEAVPCEPYLRRRWPGDSGVMASERSVQRITDFGRHYYRDNWQRYRELYPDIAAPAPASEA